MTAVEVLNNYLDELDKQGAAAMAERKVMIFAGMLLRDAAILANVLAEAVGEKPTQATGVAIFELLAKRLTTVP